MIPEPGSRRRWLYVWKSQQEAQAFADELKERTGENGWEVVPTPAPPSEGPLDEGPLGPILIQLPPEALAGLSSDELAQIQNFHAPADGVSSVPPLAPLTGTITGRE